MPAAALNAKLPAGESWLHYGCSSGHADGHKGSSGGTTQAGEDAPEDDGNPLQEGVWRKKTPAGLVWHNRRKVEAAGIEREEPSSESVAQQALAQLASDVSPLCLHPESNDRQRSALDDAILRRVIRCWPALPDETRSTINSIVVDSLLFGD